MSPDDLATDKHKRYLRAAHVFTPGAPVANRDRFAGRTDQVLSVLNGLGQPGKQVLIFGERGVGKTSLANVLHEFLTPIRSTAYSVRIACSSSDSYTSVWTKVIEEIGLPVPDEWKYPNSGPNPEQIRRIFANLDPGSVIILDEYDRWDDDDGLSLMADTIKTISDNRTAAKLVIVGVADSIDQLVGEHESVQRSFHEVPMPRMSSDDCAAIVDGGLSELSLRIAGDVRGVVVGLSEGLPYFVHQLMLTASQRAIADDRTEVAISDVDQAVAEAVKQHTLLREYETAINSPRRDNLFAKVLVACALAEKNALGYFQPSAVREPMSRIMGKPYDIPAFSRHINAFQEPERGSVLQRIGTERKYQYRFRNPMLQAFAVLVAVSDGVLPPDFKTSDAWYERT